MDKIVEESSLKLREHIQAEGFTESDARFCVALCQTLQIASQVPPQFIGPVLGFILGHASWVVNPQAEDPHGQENVKAAQAKFKEWVAKAEEFENDALRRAQLAGEV